MITHLGHKAAWKGLDMTLGHTRNVYILGLDNFDGIFGSYIIISLFHYLFLANSLA